VQLHPEICLHCRRAAEMNQRGEKGHTLRHRNDTNEDVHDFIKAASVAHAYCLATPLRKKNG
jgi:hypothetical protein